MYDFVEPRVRRLVAEHLGVGDDELAPEISLIDDLAADSLDLVELTLVLEGHFGISFPESALDRVRTYGDLVRTMQGLTRAQRAAQGGAAESVSPLVWARVVPPSGQPGGDIQRVGLLTPYTAETIAEDALRAGRGAKLEMSVPSSTSDVGLAELQTQFAWLGDRGVQVSVRRDHHVGPLGQPARPHAAA